MADVIEVVPPAVDASGNLTVVWLDKADYVDLNALTVAEITAGTRITYSFAPGGWAPTPEQAVETDDRLTLPETLQSFGKVTNSIPLTYVESTDPDSADVVLEPGKEGAFVERRGVPNQDAFAAGQRYNAYPVTLGIQRPVPAGETGKFNTAQSTISTGRSVSRKALVA